MTSEGRMPAGIDLILSLLAEGWISIALLQAVWKNINGDLDNRIEPMLINICLLKLQKPDICCIV